MPIATPGIRHFAKPQPINERLAGLFGVKPPATGASKSGNMAGKYTEKQREPLASHAPEIEQGITFAAQDSLPKLPIPDLENSITKYLAALKPLQPPREHAETLQAAEEFLKNDGPELNEKLKRYANGKTSYIEQFCKSSAGRTFVLKLIHTRV